MDENKDKPEIRNPMEIEASPPADSKREVVVFSAFDWLALLLALALAALWFKVFSFKSLMGTPGLGTTAFVLAALAAECVYLRGRLRPTRSGLLLVCATVVLAVSCGLFGDYAVRMLNLALLSFLTPASALALAGRGFPAFTASVVPETLRLFFPNLFRHFAKPFKALRRSGRSFNGFWIVFLTIVLLIPVFALVLALLGSADLVFGTLLGDLGRAILESMSRGRFLWTWLKVAVFGLMLFSFLYSLAGDVPEREDSGIEPTRLPALPFIAGLAVLDLIYAAFAAVQFVFLFGGAETAAMQGGYANYARQGFFQLAAVAGINLCAALLCVKAEGRGKKAVGVLTYLLIGFTFVILVSAVYRMCMYIGAYGLSRLRCMTLIIMLWTAIALAAVGYKTARPQFKVFPVFMGAFLTIWIIFSCMNIDAVISSYNHSAYKSGKLELYDAQYISSLGPSSGSNVSADWPNKVLFPNDP